MVKGEIIHLEYIVRHKNLLFIKKAQFDDPNPGEQFVFPHIMPSHQHNSKKQRFFSLLLSKLYFRHPLAHGAGTADATGDHHE